MAKIEDELKLILENSHNGYMFEMRCRQLKIIVDKTNDGIQVYRADNRDDEKIEIDTSKDPFQKILKFRNQ